MRIIICISLMAAITIAAHAGQSENIPESVTAIFKAKRLDKQYDFSFHMNPFYLRGDFNGDGKPDIAVLVRQTRTGKVGIAIIHSAAKDVHVVGAGTTIGNGGDNFDWMDHWHVRTKGEAGQGQAKTIALKGEALYVSKSEAASALIYWNGSRYVWRQQGD
jgi:hypothetical protein